MSGFGFEFITEKTRWILKMRCAVTYHCVDVLHSVIHVFDWSSQKINCYFFKERDREKKKEREKDKKSERERERERKEKDRKIERKTEKEKERDRERERKREIKKDFSLVECRI